MPNVGAEEIFGECPDRDKYLSGLIVNRVLRVTQAEEKPSMLVWRKGTRIAPGATMEETLIESIKGEPSLRPEKSACTNCLPTIMILNDEGVRREVKHCMYQGLTEEELPFFMKRQG